MLFAIASLTLAAAISVPSPTTTKDASSSTAVAPTEAPVRAELTLASAVLHRQAQPLPEEVYAGQTVYAFTQITGPGGGFVEHIWTRDGKEVAHAYLPVGPSKRWRTWSRHTVSAGEYHVEVLGPGGKRLQQASFKVVPAEQD